MKRLAVIVVAAALVGGIAGGAIEAALGDSSTSSESTPAPPPTTSSAATTAQGSRVLTPEAIYRAASPGVVVITDTQVQPVPATPFTPPGQEQVSALGSGFVIDRGDIVTNDHVVQGATNVRVGFSGGATYPAKVVGTDPSTDLAVIRVEAPPALSMPLRFADLKQAQVGDTVYAIGNPFGLDRTMTAGIVSAIGRDIQAPNGLGIPDAIQTDAPINHGNSGGPLLDPRAAWSGSTTRSRPAAPSTGTSESDSRSPATPRRPSSRSSLPPGTSPTPGSGLRSHRSTPARTSFAGSPIAASSSSGSSGEPGRQGRSRAGSKR